MPTGYKVCNRCLDKPFIFNKPIILPPDPVPVKDPRPAWWMQEAMQNPSLVFSDGSQWVTDTDDEMTASNNTSNDD